MSNQRDAEPGQVISRQLNQDFAANAVGREFGGVRLKLSPRNQLATSIDIASVGDLVRAV